MRRRWMRTLAVAVGAVLTGAALLVWWTAEQALAPVPEVQWSSEGGMSQCLGDRPCDPPVLPSPTVTVIVILAGVGVALIAAVLVDVALRWRARPARAG